MASELSTSITPSSLVSRSWLDDILIRICMALQLTPTQYRAAETHYHAVARWLAEPESPLARIPLDIYPQGSLRIGTTVRPWWKDEYDLDLVLQLDLHSSVEPMALLDVVQQRLTAHDTYAPMVERKNRCIRLNFAKQFHLDILPARPDPRLGGTHVLVPDCAAQSWKASNPKGYAGWFEARGALAIALTETRAAVEPLPVPEEARDKNALQLAVQLLKRWRDLRFLRRPESAPISIVLTTLAATYYAGEPDPFQALRSIVRGINAAVPTVGRLIVCNPANPFEDLSERWDTEPEAYRAFVDAMRELDGKLRELESSRGLPEYTRQLEGLFGEVVARGAVARHAQDIELARRASALRVTRSGALTTAPAVATVALRQNHFYGG